MLIKIQNQYDNFLYQLWHRIINTNCANKSRFSERFFRDPKLSPPTTQNAEFQLQWNGSDMSESTSNSKPLKIQWTFPFENDQNKTKITPLTRINCILTTVVLWGHTDVPLLRRIHIFLNFAPGATRLPSGIVSSRTNWASCTNCTGNILFTEECK